MKNIIPLLKLMQMSRNQPQYGYLLAVHDKNVVSDLAQHHYLVSFIGWQIALACERAGVKVDVRRVMELCLVHDTGELFGGHINLFYARAVPEARKAGKEFQRETERFLAKMAGETKRQLEDLYKEESGRETDEAIITRVADLTESLFYRWYIRTQGDPGSYKKSVDILLVIAKKAKDKRVQKVLIDFIKNCSESLRKDDLEEMIANKAKVLA